ncbi:MAG: hypothetical protein MZV63_40615 [Marinilabiliales bacterium]|nr:hypothetical protein [Marinilabiliales bacterium]
MDFYGFNGYQSVYDPIFEDDASSNDLYKSRMYYRMERKLIRFTADFSGNLFSENLKWVAGFAHFNHKMNSVDIDALNDGEDESDWLPAIDSVPGLYDEYVASRLIPSKEADGGKINYLKAGIVYDSRDNEANPMKGLWSEVIIVTAPSFLDNYENSYTKTYVNPQTIFHNNKSRLNFAYRLGYQGTIAGETPFYMQPYINISFSPSIVAEGLGGAKTIRGVLRDRLVGDGVIFGNLEFQVEIFKNRN